MINAAILHDAMTFSEQFDDFSINLLCFDPPYCNAVKDKWDQFPTVKSYVEFMYRILESFKPKMHPQGSVVFFQQIGRHKHRPMHELQFEIERNDLYFARNNITWGKRRARGKTHDYLFCREEILWYSVSEERTDVHFNVPLLSEKRGYSGFNAKYKAKSEYKRVSNVWTDITELFAPERTCEKPIALMERIIATHSHEDDLVVDPFCGTGTTLVAAKNLGRIYSGCDLDPTAIAIATRRLGE